MEKIMLSQAGWIGTMATQRERNIVELWNNYTLGSTIKVDCVMALWISSSKIGVSSDVMGSYTNCFTIKLQDIGCSLVQFPSIQNVS